MKQRMAVLFGRIGRYQRLMRWLSRDSLWRFKGITLLSLGLGFGGLLAQIGAIGLAAYYAHLLERGEAIELMNSVYEPRSSVALLSMIGLGALVLLMIGALAMWISGLLSVTIRRRYQDFCAARAIDRLRERRFIWSPPDKRRGDIGTVLRLIRGDAGYAGWVAQLLLAAVVPAVSTVIAIVALVSLEPLLSIGVMVLVVVSMVFLVRVNVAAAHHSKRLEQAAVPAGRDVRRKIATLRDTPHGARVEVDAEALFGTGEMKTYLDARDGRMQVMETSRFISNFFFAITLVLVLLVLGGDLIQEGTGFGRLFIYLVALRYALFSLRSVTQLLTSINRFFPQLWRYREFLEASDATPDETPRRERFTMRAVEPRVPESVNETTLRAPQRLTLLTPTELNRYTLGFLLWALVGPNREQTHAALAHARFAALRLQPEHAESAAATLGLPAGLSRAVLLEPLAETPLATALEAALPASLDEPLDDDAWRALPRGAKYAVGVLEALHDGAQWVLLDGRFLRLLHERSRAALLDAFQDRFVVIVTADPAFAAASPADFIGVADEGRLYGLGDCDWLAANLDEIESRFGAALAAGPGRSPARETAEAGGEDDDELELAGM